MKAKKPTDENAFGVPRPELGSLLRKKSDMWLHETFKVRSNLPYLTTYIYIYISNYKPYGPLTISISFDQIWEHQVLINRIITPQRVDMK